VTSAGIVMVSAIGNDGPNSGTLNNPADMPDVVGVGGIGYDDKVAPFSSRGVTTWELPAGAGRTKPDIVAYGRDVQGSRMDGGCRSLSGTSVAAPVVAGAVALLASTVPVATRWHASGGVLNPASMKQALLEGARRLPGVPATEQGAGALDLAASAALLANYTPKASVFPATIDHTAAACPHAWPHCGVALHAGAMPRIVNITILNALGVSGALAAPPTFTPTDAGGAHLDVRFAWGADLWPWSGWLGVYLRAAETGVAFTGTASGTIKFTVTSPADGVHPARSSAVSIPVAVLVAPPPPREKRLLWDQFRSVRYPPAYMPRDALEVGGSGDGGGGVGTQAAKARSTPPSLSLSRSSTTSWTGTATTPTQTCTARSTRCAARGMRWICWGRPPPASTLPITAPCSSSTRRTNSMTQKSTNWRPT
jgi:membrane-bound transcription factor site-1 protease